MPTNTGSKTSRRRRSPGTGYLSSELQCFQRPDITKLSVELEEAIGVVIPAKLTDTPSMLPGALYCCYALGSDLPDGWTRTDGTTCHLPPEDAKRCVTARATITHIEWRTFAIVFDNKPSPSCARWSRGAAGVACDRPEPSPEGDTLWDWGDDLGNGLSDDHICECCHQVLQGRNRIMLQNVWRWLPRVFDLSVEGWPTA